MNFDDKGRLFLSLVARIDGSWGIPDAIQACVYNKNYRIELMKIIISDRDLLPVPARTARLYK